MCCSTANPAELIVITRVKPRRPSTRQTAIDQERSNERRRIAGGIFHRMSAVLVRVIHGKATRVALLRMAAALASQKGITIDRGSKRLKDSLICWFCENCPEIACGGMQPAKAPETVDANWMDPIEPPCIDITLSEDPTWHMTDDDVAQP